MLIENPPGFSIHESATIAGVWPVAPCFSNLVLFDLSSSADAFAAGHLGLSGQALRAQPGYGDATRDKAQARRLLARAGFGPGKLLRVDLVTRNIAIYVDLASFVADQLRQSASRPR